MKTTGIRLSNEGGSLQVEGDLSRINVAEILSQIYYLRKSGILRLFQGEIKKSVYVKDGMVIFAHSNLKNERLGEILLRLGKITEEEFEMVSQIVIDQKKRLGQVLWERGFLSPAEINSGVSYQIQHIIFSLFNWDSGHFQFFERDRPVFEDIAVKLSTPELIVDGIRNITNLKLLRRAIGNEEMKAVVRSRNTTQLPRTKLEYGEETILSVIDDKSTVAMLRSASGLSVQEFTRALYSLMICGFVHLFGKEGPEQEMREEIQRRWTAFTTAPMKREDAHAAEPVAKAKVTTVSEEQMRRLIEDTFTRFQDTTDEEVLGVLPDSTVEEIQSSYNHLTSLYNPPFYSSDRYTDLKDQLKFVCDRLRQAYDRVMERVSEQMPLEQTTPSRITYEPHGQVAEEAPTPEQVDPAQPPVRTEETLSAFPKIHLELTVPNLQELLKKDPENVSYMRQLGLRLQDSGKAREGEKQLLRALELEPQNIETHFDLVEFYNKQKLKFKAFKHLNNILQIQPENTRALDMLGLKKRKKAMYEISTDK